MKISKCLIATALAGMIVSAPVYAAQLTMVANIAFDTPLSMTKSSDIDFGTMKASQPGTYVINTSGAVTPSGGGVFLHGTPVEGRIVVAGSSTQTVTISTGSYVPNSNVTPSGATCKYGTSAAAPCDSGLSVPPPGTATTLLVGVQVVADGTQSPGSTAAPTFTITTVYN